MEFVALLENAEDLEAGSYDARCQGVGEEIWAASLPEHIDYLLAAGGETAHCSAEGLSEGAGVDVNPAVAVRELAHSVSRRSDYSGRMGFVHHYKGVVFLCKVANLVNRGHVSVHREYSVGDDDAETLCLGFLKAALEIGHVRIGVAVSLCFAEPYAVYDGSVVERV